MRHLGILAHSTEGAALCFLAFCQEGFRELGAHPSHSPLPILDSTRLLARAAFEVAVAREPLPTWRGGPF